MIFQIGKSFHVSSVARPVLASWWLNWPSVEPEALLATLDVAVDCAGDASALALEVLGFLLLVAVDLPLIFTSGGG